MSVVANVAINVDSRNAVSKLRQVQQGAQATQRATTDLTTAFSKLQAGATNAFSKLQAGATNAAKSLSGLRGALASIGATAAVSKAFGDAQALMLAQKRLSRLTQEYKQFAGAQQEAERLANKFEVSVTDTAGALGSLASRLGAQGRSLNDIVAVYEGLNSALVATGRSSTEAAAASYQLSQALGSGSLTGDELKTISETLPELLNEVAKAAGSSSLQIRELAKDGKLSADLIIQATKQLRDKYSQDVKANITATQKFQNALSGLSEAVGTELAPAITELLKAGAEALKLFGKLPGPVKTLIAAAAGLTAAFVALAPAISATIGLLGGLSLATLAAAGPWIALAAGVTAAAVALAGYRSESQKVGGAARGGGAAEVTAASKLLAQKDAQIAGLQGQRQTASGRQRGSIDRNLAVLRRERGQLQSDVKAGTAATPTPVANAMGTPVGSAVGGGGAAGGSKKKGKTDAERAAEEAAQVEKQTQERLRGLTREIELNAQISTIKDLQFQAEMDGNKELQARLQGEERIIQIIQSTAQSLDGITDQRLQQKILAKAEGEIASANQETALEMQRIDNERTKSFNEIITGLDLELALKTATTEQAREQLRLEAEIAKLRGQGFTPEQIGIITAKKTELAKPKTNQQILKEEADSAKLALETLTKPANMIATAAAGIGDAFATSFKGIVDGSMTAKEGLASFFKSVADMFLDMAAQIIAAWMKMIILNTIVKIFGGAAGGSLTTAASPEAAAIGQGSSIFAAADGAYWPGGFQAFADGGLVTKPTMGLIGEGGESEYVIPASKMQSAMSRYSRGARGEGVLAGSGGGTEGGGAAAAAGPMVVDVRYSVERINDVEYVTASQFQAGMRQAAQQGAAQGEQRTLRRLQQSPGTRKRVGM